MNVVMRRLIHRNLKFLACGGLLAVACFGCAQQAAVGDVPAEGDEEGGVGFAVAQKARKSDLRTLRALWTQRKTSDVTPRVLSLLNSPSEAVRTRAVKMLGRLEVARALKPLEALRPKAPSIGLMESTEATRGTLYPELQLAIGRIKARNLSGRRKLDTILSEAGLSYGGVMSLTKRINTDKYGYKFVGNRVIDEVVDVLAGEREKGRDVNALTAALTLRPSQQTRLTAVSPSPTVEAERILDFVARTWSAADPVLVERLLDLRLPPNAVLDKISAKLQNSNRYPKPTGLANVLQEMAMRKNNRALSMLRALAKEPNRPELRNSSQIALNKLSLLS